MKPFLLVALLYAANVAADTTPSPVNYTGDTARGREVWSTFEHWLDDYTAADLPAVMSIFDRDLRFSFQGAKDASYADMEASYAKEFSTRKAGKRWVPQVEEIYADTNTALVRAVWELRVTAADGHEESKARNRSMDVFRRDAAGHWHIFRSINYPDKAPTG